MEELIEREVSLIHKPIISLIEKLLLKGFTNKKGQTIIKVKSIPSLILGIDEDNSGFKDKIIIQNINCNMVGVIVDLGRGSSTNNTLNIMTNKGLVLNYNIEDKRYEIDYVEEDIALLDITPF